MKSNFIVHPYHERYLKDFFRLYKAYNQTQVSVSKITNLIRKTRENNVVFLARADHTVIGYLILAFNWDIEEEGLKVQVTDFYVDQKFRRRGIGGELMQKAIAFAKRKGARRVILISNIHNRQAHSFYKRHGFEKKDGVEFRKVLK